MEQVNRDSTSELWHIQQNLRLIAPTAAVQEHRRAPTIPDRKSHPALKSEFGPVNRTQRSQGSIVLVQVWKVCYNGPARIVGQSLISCITSPLEFCVFGLASAMTFCTATVASAIEYVDS